MPNEPNDVSCLNSRAIIEYMRRHYPERLPELLSTLPSPFSTMSRPDDFLSDENNWIPSSIVVTLFEKAKEITENPRTPFDIGFESITHREFSYVTKVFLTFFSSPRRILTRMNQLNAKLNTTKTIQLLENAPGHALLRWHWRPGVRSSHDVCEYNRGIYSAVPTLWGYAPAKVIEDPCTFRGGDYCQISISWGFSAGKLIRLLERIFSGGRLLRDIQEQVEQDKAELRQKVEILKAINEATRTLILNRNADQILQQTLRPIIEVLGFDRALIMTEDEQHEMLVFRHGQVGPDEDLEQLKRYRIPLSRSENLMVRVYRSGQAEMSQDPMAMGLNPRNPILRDFHPGPSIVCPLEAGGRTIGILGVTRRDPVRPLRESDKEYVSIFANNIATAFERARLDLDLKRSYEERARIEKDSYEERTRIEKRRIEELRQSYEGAVSALVKAIEVNDEETGNHSGRVSEISEKIARHLGYRGSQLDDIRFGCILHDVGKIGLASYLELRKEGPLTDEEYERIKEHPVRGEDILKANPFFARYRTIVRNHHERWDGKGYPDGLKGEKIPLEAQIVAIADAYDAMTSNRRYRKSMLPAQAMEEIERCRGTQFSPPTVEAFRHLFERKEINGATDRPEETDQRLLRDRLERAREEEGSQTGPRHDEELHQKFAGVVEAFLKAILLNDDFTGGHSLRVSQLSLKIAEYLEYGPDAFEELRIGSTLHDVGKIGLPIFLALKKPGPLSDEERRLVREHPVRGEEILSNGAFAFPEGVRRIVRSHHERWDGKGYPDGLAGEAIPLGAQIVAVANAYDMMRSDLPHRKGREPQEAADEISALGGTQFSPRVVQAFIHFYKEQIVTKQLDF